MPSLLLLPPLLLASLSANVTIRSAHLTSFTQTARQDLTLQTQHNLFQHQPPPRTIFDSAMKIFPTTLQSRSAQTMFLFLANVNASNEILLEPACSGTVFLHLIRSLLTHHIRETPAA